MEENVALDSSKQKQFIKSIKGIKKLFKNKQSKSNKEGNEGVKVGKVRKRKQNRERKQRHERKPRGLVYLSHIPHGFYEHEMTQYFKQFGVVTNARVIRSKRTGMSKGHAFVEFKDPNVAQIVTETMNNYLMGKRLIKAALIPPEKQRRFAKRKHWNAQNNPGNNLRLTMKKAHNSKKDENQELEIAKKLLLNLSKNKQKLKELDIDYDFFVPVDIPEPLLSLVDIKTEDDTTSAVVIKKEKAPKVKEEKTVAEPNKKGQIKKSGKIKDENKITEIHDAVNDKKSKKSKKIQKSLSNKDNKLDTKTPELVKISNKEIKETKQPGKNLKDKADIKLKEAAPNKLQEEKQKKLKAAGVKPLEDFIQLQEQSGDESESSMEFDSDEYEKMIEQDDSDVPSESENDESEDDDNSNDMDESGKAKLTQQKEIKGPVMQKLAAKQSQTHNNKSKVNPVPKPMKIMPRRNSTASKPKYEKKSKKTLNKAIKKKNK